MKLDLACGKNKREGFLGVDNIKFDTVDIVMDLFQKEWTATETPAGTDDSWELVTAGIKRLKADSVDEVVCSHFVEHIPATKRIAFMNEMWRVMKVGAKAQIIVPHWASCRAYGDLTHQWPPVSEMWFYYLSTTWRETQAPHDDIKWNPDGYSCHFDATWGYSLNPALHIRNQEYQNFALSNYKEAAQDIIATLTKAAFPVAPVPVEPPKK